ncbi:DNA invertase Pin-like site-specific DNA recombinase [Actinoplanes teichomyceticus]|uniref:DNA invertase Pin-like site-specific DNA recombinase n=2 Tax=Actinoplanes teichomyceticus TaxID=1867 RepID=A0A561WAX8_ACTTI|nr:DNA invertase Pin-like site-specific DNA recombinase [Actinoplanes teichomyceticus]
MSRRRPAATPDRPERVALYVRVSAVMGRAGDDFHSPEIQVAAMRRVTANMEEVALIDDDIDQTGRTFSRAGIEKIRKLAEAGSIDAVAVYNISRFGRNVLESLQFLTWLADRGVTILSATEHIDTSTPSGRWMLTNLLAIAEMRSDEIGNEWRSAIHHRTKAGRPHGKIPVGYERGEDGRLTPHPTHGPAVARAFADFAEGASVRQVARDLRAVTGLRMSGATARMVLRNRAYRGEVRAGGASRPDAHEPLVDPATWTRVEARLRETAVMPSRLAEPKYALSGLLWCGVCGGRGNHRPQDQRTRTYCRRQVEEEGCVGFGTPDAAKLAAGVLEKVRAKAAELRGDIAGAAVDQSGAHNDAARAAALSEKLAETRRAMVRAAEGWSRGRMDDRTYDATMAALERDEREQQGALDQITIAPVRLRRGEMVSLADRLLLLWPRMNELQRNRALKDVVKAVTVLPVKPYARTPAVDRIRVDWL